MKQFKFSLDAQMFEAGLIKDAMEFYGFAGKFMEKLADPEGKG